MRSWAVPLAAPCPGGVSTFIAPAGLSGDQVLNFYDADGVLLHPLPCPPDTDTADTASPACDEPLTVTYAEAP